MFLLLADTATTETVTHATESGFFPPYFGVMLLALVLTFVVGVLLQLVGYKVIDRITPGNLCKELTGEGRPDGKPNVALALVVAAMFLGMSITMGCTIIGVMVH